MQNCTDYYEENPKIKIFLHNSIINDLKTFICVEDI